MSNKTLEQLIFIEGTEATKAIQERTVGDTAYDALQANLQPLRAQIDELVLMTAVGENTEVDTYLLYVRYKNPTDRQWFTKSRAGGCVFLNKCGLIAKKIQKTTDCRAHLI